MLNESQWGWQERRTDITNAEGDAFSGGAAGNSLGNAIRAPARSLRTCLCLRHNTPVRLGEIRVQVFYRRHHPQGKIDRIKVLEFRITSRYKPHGRGEPAGSHILGVRTAKKGSIMTDEFNRRDFIKRAAMTTGAM